MPVNCHNTLPEAVLARLSDLVAARLGLNFPQERWPDLERSVRDAARARDAHEVSDFVDRVLSSPANSTEMELLATHLTVGETYFFRDEKSLGILRDHILPPLMNNPVRIWSAGCATGEEPYSIAMLLSRLMPEGSLTILATDLNAQSLQKASEGVYGEWSFRNTPPWIRALYFSPSGEKRWAISPAIKKSVKFARLNLIEDAFFASASEMDIILCRNVIMYLHPEAATKAIDQLYRSLKPGGWLLVSAAEASHTLFAQFSPVRIEDTVLYRKSAVERTPPAPSFAPSEPFADWPIKAEWPIKEELVAVPAEADRTAAMLRLARKYANQGKLRDAYRWCEKLIATGKADSRAHQLRAAVLEELGSLEEAARSLRRAIFLDPDFAVAHYAMGNLAAKRGRLKESERHFENTLAVLAAYPPYEVLPEFGGLTAGRLRELITRRTHG